MSLSIYLAIMVSFLATLIITPKLIIFLQRIGMVGTDIQKKSKPKIAEMGGPAILVGFLAGIFIYMWIKVFLYGGIESIEAIFAAISTILIVTFIGIFDDLSVLMKKVNKGFKRIGLRQWQKPLLTLPAAVPLMAIMVGSSTMSVPFVGIVDFGILYPLLLVPVAIVGASNAVNMLAGMNGLESSLGLIYMTSLGIYSYHVGSIAAAAIAFSVAASLLAFLWFNKYPAKIMPGDSVVYMIGASAATVAIIGNIEKFAVLAFTPWIIEFFLKLRSKFKAECFGKLQPDGTLKPISKKIYSLTHVVMRMGRFKEWQIVLILSLVEVAICSALLLFYMGL
ncbi:MAG: glycosyltransferase 4 family protein [Candidatus Aenigmatarchaeota archaeon]